MEGQTCKQKCGVVLEKCSCHTTCAYLLDCCGDYKQFCLRVSPYSGSMLGGSTFTILNLVFAPGERVICRFKGSKEIEGFVDPEGRAHCVLPLLHETGFIPFEVSTDGVKFDRSGEYLSVHPSELDPALKVTLVNKTQWQHYSTPHRAGPHRVWSHRAGPLTMTWNSSLIRSDRVDIELWGYREVSGRTASEGNNSASLQAEWSYLYSLGRDLPNTGAFSFIPKPSVKPHSNWEAGSIRVKASSSSEGARDVQGLWSEAHALAWHLEQAFRNTFTDWAENKCLAWDDLEKTLPKLLDEIADCPCTLAQARADTGRFHTDSGCDTQGGSMCTFHPGTIRCVRSIQTSPRRGSGQQCCYDGTGAQVLTRDLTSGSTPELKTGVPLRMDIPPRIPGLSHRLTDVMSFYYCCLWSDNCHVYFRHRSSSGCKTYRPPRAGAVLGDPHFITFDDLHYTFSGEGEYYLVSSPDKELSVQVRTQRGKPENDTLAQATRLSSVAMKQKASDVIEVRLPDDRDQLQVLRNQKVLSFSEQRWMDLHGVSVFSASPQNVTIMFASGVGVEVRRRESAMAVTVLLPTELINNTKGLLGQMNSDPTDDLMTSQGEVINVATTTAEEIFTFGTSWNISKETSLFTYDSKYLFDTYYYPPKHDTTFIPAFSLPETPDDPLVADMLKMCYGNGAQFCKYDTLTSRSLAQGNATLRAYQSHEALMQDLEQVVSCGWLPTPRNGKKNGTSYLEGTVLDFSCNEGFKLYGSSQRTCLEDGTWTGVQPHCLKVHSLSITKTPARYRHGHT
ncbi:sushi domain-containing protein 2 [Lampris incognitus]|uniref:sushi domain-containing protein 2 n=1 Tax=Lampris incognitus TaxID=2546036 RepID=UPI0024B57B7F|nr:sushi domain-containing protein 2 [Lampris incognitus]